MTDGDLRCQCPHPANTLPRLPASVLTRLSQCRSNDRLLFNQQPALVFPISALDTHHQIELALSPVPPSSREPPVPVPGKRRTLASREVIRRTDMIAMIRKENLIGGSPAVMNITKVALSPVCPSATVAPVRPVPWRSINSLHPTFSIENRFTNYIQATTYACGIKMTPKRPSIHSGECSLGCWGDGDLRSAGHHVLGLCS